MTAESFAKKWVSIYLKISIIAIAHIVFLVGAAATKVFQVLSLPFELGPIIYFGISTVVAALAYGEASKEISILASLWRNAAFAVVASVVSLYAGVFLAFNMFGT